MYTALTEVRILMVSSTTTLTIRLSVADSGRLDREAKLRNIPRSEFARDAILLALEGGKPDGVVSELALMKSALEELKISLRESVRVLLITGGRATEEKISAFLTKHFGNQSEES